MKKKTVLYMAVSLIFGLALTACGASDASGSYADTTTESISNSDDGYGAYYSDDYNYDYDEAVAEESDYAAEDAVEGSGELSKDNTADVTTTLTDEKIIYTGSLTLETQNYEETLESISNMISSYDGIVENREESGGSYDWYSDSYYGYRNTYIVVRIPSPKFEEFINAAGDVGHLTNRNSSAENISKEYQSVSVEIEALQKEEARLLEMMDMATTIEEMIQVESRLTEVESRLNQYISMRNNYDTDVKYSTVRITVNEVGEYTPTEEVTFATRLKEAFIGSGENIVSFAQGLLIFLIYAVPVFAILGLIAYLIYRIIRGSIRRSRAKKEKKRMANMQQQGTPMNVQQQGTQASVQQQGAQASAQQQGTQANVQQQGTQANPQEKKEP